MNIASNEEQDIEEQQPRHYLAHDDDRYEEDIIDEEDPVHSARGWCNRHGLEA